MWAASIGFLIWAIVREILEIVYARKRYEDYLIWETERTQHRLDLIAKNKYPSNTVLQSTNATSGKAESSLKTDAERRETEHVTINETSTTASNTHSPTMRSHHSQHHPLPPTLPTIIKGKPIEAPPTQQQPIDAPLISSDPSNSLLNGPSKKKKNTTNNNNNPFMTEPTPTAMPSRFVRRIQRAKNHLKARLKSYYMYYSLNNLFDWIIYTLCLVTVITHFIDVGSHTVIRARIHMYIASVTVICVWFRFMVFFRTISISAKTLRSKLVEIKLGELVIMVREKNRRRTPLPR